MILKNKIIFITGASSGIGAACAKQFAQQGANLILCARRLDLLNEYSAQLQRIYNVKILCLPIDVRNRAMVNNSISSLPPEWQEIDVLINNAGLAAGLDFIQDGNVDDWEQMIDTNVKGLLYMTRAIIPQMVQRKSGHIINIGSISGHHLYPKGAVYCSTKYAVKALTQGFRMDLAGTNVRVTTVDPGMVETSFSQVRFKGDTKKAAAVYQGVTPLAADDVADSVVYCATRPPHVNISELIVTPLDQVSVTMVTRKE